MLRHKERESKQGQCQWHYYAQRSSVVRRYLVFSALIILRCRLPATTPYTQFKEPFFMVVPEEPVHGFAQWLF
jgi:hypothetical protein